LRNSRHTGDRLALLQFFAHEQRQNKVVNAQMGFTDQVPQSRGTPQATRSMHQSSHRARLPARHDCRKPTVLPAHGGCLTARSVGCLHLSRGASFRLFIDRCQ
jgi:hypothetical protein